MAVIVRLSSALRYFKSFQIFCFSIKIVFLHSPQATRSSSNVKRLKLERFISFTIHLNKISLLDHKYRENCYRRSTEL